MTGHARILLLAENYAQMWQYVAAGGMVGVTTVDRLQRVQSHDPTFADASGRL